MKTRAFTIVELVLVIALLGIVMASLTPWLINTVKAYDLISSRRTMLAQVRAGVDRMVREIRLIPGQAQVTTTTASTFTFQYPAGTSISYTRTGTNVMRNSNALINNVTSLAFTYYDQGGSTTTTAANVRSVQIQLTATTADGTSNLTIRTRVFIRNTGNYYLSFTSP